MKKRGIADGQFDIFGTIHNLDKLVCPPDIIESNGLKVIHFIVSEENRAVPGYLNEVNRQDNYCQRLNHEVSHHG